MILKGIDGQASQSFPSSIVENERIRFDNAEEALKLGRALT
jgi:hypothetical protein